MYLFINPVKVLINRLFFILNMADINTIEGYVSSFGIGAPLVSLLLMVFQSIFVPLPNMIIFANVNLFGLISGAILSWISIIIGAISCFIIGRFFGRQIISRVSTLLGLQKYEDYFNKYGRQITLVARLFPFLSFDIFSYAAGLTSMTLSSFILGTGLGKLPAILLYSYTSQIFNWEVKTYINILLLIVALCMAMFLIYKIRKERNKNL